MLIILNFMVLNAKILFTKHFMDSVCSLKCINLFYFMHWLLHKPKSRWRSSDF